MEDDVEKFVVLTHEDLVNFGYKSNMKYKSLIIFLYFWLQH